ncbi:hypothetical protein ACIA5C_47950 [Actinoplanes sp. NPDC051343]
MTTTARPGGLPPEHLWLADDEDKLVVSVLAPKSPATPGMTRPGRSPS